MIYEFLGLDQKTYRTTNEAEAYELMDALDDLEDVSTFDVASNGANMVYRSPEEEEKDRCYTAWGYR